MLELISPIREGESELDSASAISCGPSWLFVGVFNPVPLLGLCDKGFLGRNVKK